MARGALRAAARCAAALRVSVLLVAGCPAPEPLFPEDYLATYEQVRDCRPSADHDLHNIRVLADPLAFEPYLNREDLFPEGATLVKQEFDFGDIECEGDPIEFSAAIRLAFGAGEETLGWRWQKVDAERRVLSENDSRCIGCHDDCVPPDGYQSTCAVPP